MTSTRLLNAYTWAFLAFMFAPLLLMVLSSFNDISPPSVTEWHGFTTKWYRFFWMPEAELRADPVLRVLDRGRFIGCFGNSLSVAAIVVPLALVMGLSGAVMLTRWQSRANGLLWWVLLSPMLAPGIVLGLSALVFWGRLGVNAGLFTIIMAQATFLAGYPLLVLMAQPRASTPTWLMRSPSKFSCRVTSSPQEGLRPSAVTSGSASGSRPRGWRW